MTRIRLSNWFKRRLAVLALVAGTLGSLAAGAGEDAPMDPLLDTFLKEFVTLTPGRGNFPASFTMGSTGNGRAEEKPAHKVAFAQPLAMAKYEVTQELYEKVMGKNPSRWKGRRNSVEMVNWQEARDFCTRVTALLHENKLVATDLAVRLPSEAEWEYACRAGTTAPYSFGARAEDLKDYAWFKGNAKGEDPPVGKKKPNGWGLYDMHGYVWEWCQDAWHPSYEGAPSEGKAWEAADATERVARGGSWADSAEWCRSAARQKFAADHRSDALGFRCVLAAVERNR